MKKKVLGFLLAAALVVSGIRVPSVVHAEDGHVHSESEQALTETTEVAEEEQVSALSETVTCNLVPEGSVSNPEFIVKKLDGTILVPDQKGALSYVLNELPEGVEEVDEEGNKIYKGDTVILKNTTVELTEDATVKPGVTLLLPYAEGKTESNPSLNSGGQGATYSTLLIKAGVRLVVEGNVIVAAETGQISTAVQNVVTGGYSVIMTEEQSLIDVDDGQVDVYGYIRGQGSLIAREGAIVRDLYTVLGFKGGTALAEDLGVGKGEASYPYPFDTSGCGGIEINAKYYKGSTMYGATKFYLSSRNDYCGENFLIIGEYGLYRQGQDASSYIERVVSPAAKQEVLDEETIRFAGGGSMAGSALKVSFSGISVAVTTKKFVYPIGSHTTIELVEKKGLDNSLYVERAFKFLKGSELIIGAGTSITLSEKAEKGTFYANIFGNTGGQDSAQLLVFYEGAKLTVNGLLQLEKDGTLAINKDAITIGPNGNIKVACTHEKVTSYTLTEKSGDVTVTIDWSQTDAVTSHGSITWNRDAVKHSGRCADCGERIEEEHAFGATVTTAVSCEQDGKKVKTCKVCDYEDVVITEKAWGHAWEEEWEVQGEVHVKDCTNEGCDQVNAVPHDWNVLERIEPTYEEEGYESAVCKVCAYAKEGPVPVLVDLTSPKVEFKIGVEPFKILTVLNDIIKLFIDDIPVKISARDDETGLRSVEYFVSDVRLSEEEVALRTEWLPYEEELKFTEDRDYFVYVKATDNSDNVKIQGSDGLAIDRIAAEFEGIVLDAVKCGDTTVRVIDRYIDKVYVNGEEVALSDDNTFVLKPSEEPYTVKAVDHTGNESVVENVMVMSGHVYSDWEIMEDTHQRVCSRCNYVDFGEHDYSEYEVVKELTCDQDGIMVRYCNACDKKHEQNISSIGHQLVLIEEKDATARKDGYKKSQCVVCREIITEVIPALNGSSGGSSKGPATGDSYHVVMWFSVGLAALVVIKTTRRKMG